MTPLQSETKALALSYDGQRETDGPNDSPDIRIMQAHCGCVPPAAYCACFVSWTIHTAGMRVPVLPQFKRSSGALRLLGLNLKLEILEQEAIELMGQGIPVVFVQDHGGGKGHCGFGIGLVDVDTFESMEGNTGPSPSAPKTDRDGGGFYHRHDRRIDSVKGWLRVA